MAIETITKCDLCGAQRTSLEAYHWSDTIKSVILSMKEHPGVQRVPFAGDICSNCGRELADLISAFVVSKQALKSTGTKK